METTVALSDNESVVMHLIKHDLIQYKAISDLQIQLYQEPKFRTTLNIVILFYLKIWENNLQEEFSEFYFSLIDNIKIEKVDFSLPETVDSLTKDIYKKLKAKAQSSDTARRQRQLNFVNYDQTPIVLKDKIIPVKERKVRKK